MLYLLQLALAHLLARPIGITTAIVPNGPNFLTIKWHMTSPGPKEKVLQEKLRIHLPPGCETIITRWILNHEIRFVVSKPRKTKLGDYRPAIGRQQHTITINGDLNPYSFLVTTIHEFAHYFVFDKYGTKAMPHGKEWQNAYSFLLKGFLERKLFPVELEKAIRQYAMSPNARSCANPHLQRALSKYDQKPPLFLADLPANSLFELDEKLFIKGEKQRTRYKCKMISNGRYYLVHGMAPIKLPEST